MFWDESCQVNQLTNRGTTEGTGEAVELIPNLIVGDGRVIETSENMAIACFVDYSTLMPTYCFLFLLFLII